MQQTIIRDITDTNTHHYFQFQLHCCWLLYGIAAGVVDVATAVVPLLAVWMAWPTVVQADCAGSSNTKCKVV
eukprot:2867233-Amphidinium_carterae.1